MTIIKTENLSKTFKMGGGKVNAVKGVNLEIQKGEFVSIMGPSGSGKTTLLNLIGCLDKPTGGEIYIEGEPVSKLSDVQKNRIRVFKIGFIFQTFNLLPTLTAWENVALPGLLAKVKPKEREKRARKLLSGIGMEHRVLHYVSALSAGEQQRVAIARAIFNRPSIVLADEPTGNLDSKTKKEIAQLLKKINSDYQTAILLVTHDAQIIKTASRILKMVDGKV